MSIKQWIKDGLRGRPDVDLSPYAEARGLEFCGNDAQLDHVPAFPLTRDLQFNVMRGTLPGGETGVLYHEVQLVDQESSQGTFYGEKVSFSQVRAKDFVTLVDEPTRYFKVPHTTVGVRVPQAQGALVGMDVGRNGERVLHAAADGEAFKSGFTIDLGFLRRKKKEKSTEPLQMGPQPFIGRDLRELGLPGWRVAYRGRARKEVVEQVLAGPVHDLVSAQEALGFRIIYAYGVVRVTGQHFLREDAELDAFAASVSRFAGQLRDICLAGAPPRPFDSELAEPSWAARIDAAPHETFLGMDGQDLGGFHRIARERGLASEDPFELHRAFPDLPIPGEAYGVGRGVLPGTTHFGRVASGIDRPIAGPPPFWDRVLDELPHGPFGSDAVLLAVRPDAHDAHPDLGARWGDGAYAVRRGVLVAWRPRATRQADGAALDDLVRRTVALADEQGLLRAG